MTTLCLSKPGLTIHRTQERFVVRNDGQFVNEVPAIQLHQIAAFAGVSFTPLAIELALEKAIDVVFLTRYGKFLGRIHPPQSTHGELRHRQHLAYENQEERLRYAQMMLLAKIHNQSRLIRKLNGGVEWSAGLNKLEAYKQRLVTAKRIPELLPLEGNASSVYFSILREYSLGSWGFKARAQNPPPDQVNILLSLGYTVLYSQTIAAIEQVGLDPACGMLHEFRFGHAALASDLMEPFRPVIVDAVVVQGIKKQVFALKDFTYQDGRWRISDDGLKLFFSCLHDRFQAIVSASTTNDKKNYPLCSWILEQTRNYAKTLQTSARDYQPFLWDDPL